MPKAEKMSSSFGAGRGQRGGDRGKFGTNSPFQKSTLGGTLFAFASMLIGNWLDKRLSQRKEKKKSA
jgi:hypothetical protein